MRSIISYGFIFIIFLFLNNAFAQKTQRGFKVVKELEESADFKPYNKKYALIIGIDNYQNGITPLNYAVADARAIQQLFSKKLGFDEVITLENEKADRRGILRAISILRGKMTEEDQLFFYFAGHGISYGKGSGEIGFLVTQNAMGFQQEDIEIDGISMTDLRERLVKLPAKHVLLAVDACYGGYAAVSTRSLPDETLNYLKIISNSKARQIITAGKRGQEVQESQEWGHSAFTYKLLDAINKELADGDRNGIITGTELYSYLSSSVTSLTSGFQTPQYARLTGDEGEFVIILESDDEENITVNTEPEKIEVGDVKVISSGTLEVTSYINGKLYIDDRYLSDVKEGTILPINNIKSGKRKVKIVNEEGAWNKEAYVFASQTTQVIASRITEKAVTKTEIKTPDNTIENPEPQKKSYPPGYTVNVDKTGKTFQKSENFKFGVWYDKTSWTNPNYNLNSMAEIQFATFNDEAWGMVIAEKGNFTLESLKNAVVANANRVATDVKLVKNVKKLINGKEMLQIEVEAKISDLEFVYFGNLYVDQGFAVQFLSYTSKELFPKHRAKMDSLISGIEIN
ncbi:MAG: caspase family protein [Leptolyngbya sp. SIO3F4]|nr:caspase family protein [Leptolyngbya sp. SIO3F4]